ncbi:heme/copper-type cytochrome/quinol oxidase subunit 1 [Caldalkalibacillus uzonensis]|uniref:Heme/copper-type cytochrome/quinol oxidase subunit 1 n=1 Tax=Caldalkalibacillus uzonensis TaxID=353224 RepID=A0ABU0CTT3_9BACI|nr:heme/copper-type cytochrome/quinol oxidase subunit 1 [Caldalkalibacillus uzonensis]
MKRQEVHMNDSTATQAEEHNFRAEDRRIILAHIGLAISALLVGALAGLLQTLERVGWIQLPRIFLNYYQLLTIHGVLLALVFTTLFIFGYLYAGLARTLGGHLTANSRKYAWIGFYLMAIGTILAMVKMMTNEANVLYTFYAPMHASPWFYVGLALLIVGSWVASLVVIMNYWRWRRAHRKESSPLFAYMAWLPSFCGCMPVFSWPLRWWSN